MALSPWPIRSMLEVFANGRQCLTQRLYPQRDNRLGVADRQAGEKNYPRWSLKGEPT